MYAIYDVKTKKVYVAQTGDTGTLKSMVPRMQQHVPCVNRLIKWEIHGSVNLTLFCCGWRVAWCHCVRFSCYLHQKRATKKGAN